MGPFEFYFLKIVAVLCAVSLALMAAQDIAPAGARRPAAWLWSAALAAMWGIGVSALVDRFWFGLGPSTHLTDQFPWGLWKFNVLWGIALGAGGFLTAAIVYVFRLKKFEPLLRPAVLIAFLAYQCMGVGSLLIDLGRPYKIWHTIIYWQHDSLLFEISWCIMIYTCVLTVEFLPVILEKFNLHALAHKIHRAAVPFVIVGVIASTLHQSSLGGLFLIVPQKITALWYSPFMPVFFLVSAVISGLGMILVMSWASRRIVGRGLPPDIPPALARAMQILIVAYVAARLADVTARGGWADAAGHPEKGFSFLLEMGLLALAPVVVAARRFFKNPEGLYWRAGALAVAGVILNRLNVAWLGMMPAGEFYWPAWRELAITGFLASVAMTLFFLAARHWSIYNHGNESS